MPSGKRTFRESFVNIPAPSYEMEVGESILINDVVVTGDGNLTYAWQSSNSSVVSVNGSEDSATLTAVGAGQATVTLTVKSPTDSGSDSVLVTVNEKAVAPVKAQAAGSTSLNLAAGTNQAVSVTATGGSGSYNYRWQGSDGIGVDSSSSRPSNTVYGLYAGTGQVTVTVEDANDSANYAVVTWNVTVSEAAKPLTATLDKSQLSLSAGASSTLTLTASGGSGSAGNYVYYWQSDNPSVAAISGSGSTVTVKAGDSVGSGGGTADIQATVFDNATQTSSAVLHCYVTVKSNQATYDASATATVGADLAMNYVANSIGSEYSGKFGGPISYSASVRLDTVSGAAGYLTLQDGTPVRANASYSFAGFQDMGFNPSSAGSFSTRYTIVDGGNTISGTIRIQVAGGAGITNATLSPASMRLATYSSQFLTLSVTPSNASYTVAWSSSDTRIVTVAGSGTVVNVVSQGNTGTANVVATIRDSSGGTLTKTIPVTVYTDDATRTYDPSLTITIGSDYYGTSISDSIAKQWKKYFSVTLGDSAKVVFNSTGTTRYGVLRLYSGSQIKANTNYTFADLMDMYFEPYAAGTFSIPYTITYRGDQMSGTIQFNIRAASLNVTLSPSSATMTPYSTQYLNLSVTPSNAYYKVAWSSSNTSVATVTGNANTATVTAQGKAGTATITATVTDNYNNKIYRSCSVKVNTAPGGSYDPTVYTTLGVNYTGTGTSDAMASQFRNLYNTNLDANKAIIRFTATGDNKVGVMHLANGSAIKANTNYTFAQYRGMYLEPLSVGTFRIPYTLTYNNQSLYGTANVVISSGNVNCTLTLPNSSPYVFNQAVNGITGGALLSNAIRNAVGNSWTYVRFSNTAGTVGTLYENNRSAVLNGNTNVTANGMNQLYFVPARTGTYTVAFTVYSNNGKMADGTLKIIVPGSAETSFVDVPANAYYADAVTWALQKEVTAGTTKSTFSPGETVTRAQAVTFLWRAMGKPSAGTSNNPFVDVPANEYYTQAVLWAVRQGITAGTSANTFSPNDTLVQDQMLTFLCRTSGGTASGANWSDQAMSWAKGMGLFNGMPSQVSAKSRCPRSDVVYYLWKDLT